MKGLWIGKKNERVSVGIVRLIAADALAEKGGDVTDLGSETLAGECLLDASHTEFVPVIFLNRLLEVFGDFVHVEEADANAAARDSTDFSNGDFEASQ